MRFREFVPDYAKLQFAGQIGLLSLGAGYSWWDARIEPELAYGYVPEWAGGIAVHTLSQKTTLSPGKFAVRGGLSISPLLLGYSANFGMGKKYELIQPRKHWDYYWPSALHFWFFAGAKARLDFAPTRSPIHAIGAVVEMGTLNAYWQAYWSNDTIPLKQALSLALAVQGYF